MALEHAFTKLTRRSTVEDQVNATILNFLNRDGALDPLINYTYMLLIPKVNNPSIMSD